MHNRCILFFTDNESLVHVINKQSSDVFRAEACLNLSRIQYCFKAKHIDGVKNRLADSLSRLQVQYFKQLAPAHMDKLPTEISLHLQPQGWQP